MSGFAKDGVLYPSGIYAINDSVVSADTGWSSKKVMDKLASVKSIMRVDEKPTITADTITYIKDGTTYTTTDSEAWFYYVIDNELYKTIFIDGVEYTKADSGVSFDDFIEKSAIVKTLLNDTVTNEQVVGAKIVHELTKGKNLKTYTDYPDVGIDRTNFTLEEVATKLNNASALMVGTDNRTPNIFPEIFGHFIALRKSDDKVKFFFFPNENGEPSSIYFCGYHPRIGVTEWQKVCTTSVPDVPKTNVSSKLINATISSGGGVYYSVKNGICNVQIAVLSVSTSTNGAVIFPNGSFPKTDINNTNGHYPVTSPNATCGLLVFDTNGEVRYYGDSMTIYATISYPVADDWRP